ncbi:MAG TPA: N-acetylmuramoyl-L-alanine amidase [Chondromyces sp.]|nr:N-acetylmuramoyl-L-alanine amidase [Chondromyces sp.]
MKKMLLLPLLCVLFVSFIFEKPAAALTFNDIGTTHRAKEEVYFLAEGGIVNGTSNGDFEPDRLVTRAEAAAMIGRALQYNGTKQPTGFNDVEVGNFASGYIKEAVDNKIIKGYSDGSFRPYQSVTRGEMALFIGRAFDYPADDMGVAIASLREKGIAQGVSETSFGTTLPIKRSDFAVFLARAIKPELRLAAQTANFSKEEYVRADFLNIRTGPSTKYEVVGKVNFKEEVRVGHSVGNWVYISYGNVNGFVNSYYLSSSVPSEPVEEEEPKPAPAPAPAPTPTAPSLSSEVIVLDPGHGGSDPGAVGFGLREKDVVLDTAKHAKKYFDQAGFTLKMTRSTDVYLSLNERVKYAKNVSGDAFISIHANAASAGATGSETFYYNTAANPYPTQSRVLATYVQNRLLEAWNLRDRGVKHGNFHVIRENSMPAILVELGFITNKSDNDKLKSTYWREKAGRAIYLGTLDFYYHYKGADVRSLYNIANASPSRKLH